MIPQDETDLEDYIDNLRSQIKADLISMSANGKLTLDEAKAIAKSTADVLPYTLTSKEQVAKAVENLQKTYPQYAGRIKAIVTLCEVKEARKTVDAQVLPQIKAGKIDAALDTIKQFKFN